MGRLLILLVLLITIFSFTENVEAKVLPQSGKNAPRLGTIRPTRTTIGVYPRLRPDRRALIVNFSNLQNAKSVSYMLVYKTSEQEEAAAGALSLKSQSTEKIELLFGTCSAGVCRYHTGVNNARLEVSYTSINGKKYLKKYRIKI